MKTSVLTLFIVTLFSLSSCSSNPKPEDTKKEATEHNEAKFSNTNEADAKFLVSAAEINLAEIQLGQLAETKSLQADVKDLGATMSRDHSKANLELQELAASKQISLPTSITNDGQDAYKKMMNEKGNQFDKAYCDMLVSGHKEAIDNFEKASKDAIDPDIKAWASSMLPV